MKWEIVHVFYFIISLWPSALKGAREETAPLPIYVGYAANLREILFENEWLVQFRPQFIAFCSKTIIPNSIRVTFSESAIFALSFDTKLKKCSHAPFKFGISIGR